MSKKIIGLTGEMGSGKDTVAKYLREKYAAESFRFSDVLRALLGELEQSITRGNLTKLSKSLRDTFGENVLALCIAKKASKVGDETLVVIDGIRRESDLLPFQDDQLTLVYIDVPLETRFERILLRRQNEDEHTKTLEEFKADHQLETERAVPDLKAKAQFVFDNSGMVEELYAQIEKLMTETA